MRKFKNIVVGGIETKILELVVFAMILIVAVCSALIYYQYKILGEAINKTNDKQQQSITETTTSVIDRILRNNMEVRTNLQAEIANEIFEDLEDRVDTLGFVASELFNNESDYKMVEYNPPDPDMDGLVTSQTIIAPGVNEADVADRIGIAGNLNGIMTAQYFEDDEINSCFVALPEGVMISVDDRSASKFNKDGTPVQYDPRERGWYKMAEEKRHVIFSNIDSDAFTGEMCITCAHPVYVHGRLAAVIGADLFLNTMEELIDESAYGSGGFMCVINQDGQVVFSPKEEGIFKVNRSAEAQDLRKSDNKELASVVTDSLREKTDIRLVKIEDKEYYMVGVPMETPGWALLSVFSRENEERPAAILRENYQQIQDEADAEIAAAQRSIYLLLIVVLLAVSIVLIVIAAAMGQRIVHPLNKMTAKIQSLDGTNMAFEMVDAYRTGDEIEVLADSFSRLTKRNIDYVEEVRRVSTEKERIAVELDMARKIQESMLPHTFPAFPDQTAFDLYAVMDPAREVGGDFYDYFMIDEDHLCLAIADVSGKGIPAALFMMACMLNLENFAAFDLSPAEILTRTNEAICRNNQMEMFVSTWLGILEISTGKLIAANAGHEYPAIMRDNKFELFKDEHGLVMGGLEGVTYHEYELTLNPGDKLFVYTDGIVEAVNKDMEQFGTDRMIDVLNKTPEASPQLLIENVLHAVDDFVGDCEQFDDQTMLCVVYVG